MSCLIDALILGKIIELMIVIFGELDLFIVAYWDLRSLGTFIMGLDSTLPGLSHLSVIYPPSAKR